MAEHPRRRWIFGAHLVWLLANVAWIAGLVVRSASGSGVPLAYAASFLAAAPVHDFRFLYPSTLAVQCLTVAALLGWLATAVAGDA